MNEIVLGCDHGGDGLKNAILEHLTTKGFLCIDTSPECDPQDDFPSVGKKAAELILEMDTCGVLACGTGIGIGMAANKVTGIRAAVVYSEETAAQAKQHLNAQVICLGGKTLADEDGGYTEALKIVDAWLNAVPLNDRKYLRRNRMLDEM